MMSYFVLKCLSFFFFLHFLISIVSHHRMKYRIIIMFFFLIDWTWVSYLGPWPTCMVYEIGSCLCILICLARKSVSEILSQHHVTRQLWWIEMHRLLCCSRGALYKQKTFTELDRIFSKEPMYLKKKLKSQYTWWVMAQ